MSKYEGFSVRQTYGTVVYENEYLTMTRDGDNEYETLTVEFTGMNSEALTMVRDLIMEWVSVEHTNDFYTDPDEDDDDEGF